MIAYAVCVTDHVVGYVVSVSKLTVYGEHCFDLVYLLGKTIGTFPGTFP